MRKRGYAATALLGAGLALSACAEVPTAAAPVTQAPAAPSFETRKISDNVYLFRYRFHQSIFIVTRDGVIATNPIAQRNPAAAEAYIAEIRKITQAPIKYVIYTHHHYDHVEGGKPFKDLGAKFIAHRNATARLAVLKNPLVVTPDISVGDRYDITLGGVKVELRFVGRSRTDNALVILVPRDKLLFAVDFITVASLPFRDMPDSYLPDWFTAIDKVLAMDWDRLIPGHPDARGRLGTKDDVRDLRAYLSDLSEATQAAAAQGKCYDRAMAEIKLPKYEKWDNYAQFLPGNVERFCEYWNNGM